MAAIVRFNNSTTATTVVLFAAFYAAEPPPPPVRLPLFKHYQPFRPPPIPRTFVPVNETIVQRKRQILLDHCRLARGPPVESFVCRPAVTLVAAGQTFRGPMSKDTPLSAKVEGDELVIRIGLHTLAFAAEHCPLFYDYEKNRHPPFVDVADAGQLAHDTIRALFHEREDGSTPLGDTFDQATLHAFEDGSTAFEG